MGKGVGRLVVVSMRPHINNHGGGRNDFVKNHVSDRKLIGKWNNRSKREKIFK